MASAEVLTAYRRRVCDDNTSVSLPTISVSIPLERCSFHLAPLPQIRTDRREGEHEQQGGKEGLGKFLLGWSPSEEAVYREQIALRKEGFPLKDLRCEAQKQRRTVVLGVTGSGKTTLLRALASHAAQEDAVPVLVSLREYSLALRIQAQSLREFALKEASQGDGQVLDALTKTPEIFWLLDDFDATLPNRAELLDQILALAGDVVLTSRPGGFQAVQQDDLSFFELLPLTADETNRWSAAVFEHIAAKWGKESLWDEAQLRQFFTTLQRGAQTLILTRNPLLLALLLGRFVHAPEEVLPEQRSEIVRAALHTLLDNLNEPPGAFRALLLRSLWFLGWQIHQHTYDALRTPYPSLTHWKELLAGCLTQEWQDASANSEQAAEAVLKFWQQAGILEVHAGESVRWPLKFRQTAFQEYAAARYLVEEGRRNTQRLCDFLGPRVHYSAWHEVLVNMADELPPDATSSLVSNLIRGKSFYERSLYRDLRVAVRLLRKMRSSKQRSQQRLLRQFRRLTEDYTVRYTTVSQLMHFLGLTGVLAGVVIFQKASPFLTLLSAFTWTLLWHGAFNHSMFPRTQEWLAFPVRRSFCLPERDGLMQVLKFFRVKEAIPLLLEALLDRHPHVRQTAIEALAQFENSEVVPALSPLLHDSSGPVRRRVALTLGKIGHVPLLVEALADREAGVRKVAVESLVGLGNARVLSELSLALDDSRANARRSAVTAIARIGGHEALSPLLKALESHDPSVRLVAAEALGNSQAAEAITALVGHLHDEEWRVALTSAHALRQFNDPSVSAALLQALRTTPPSVQQAINDALLALVRSEHLPLLLQALQEDSDAVRLAVVRALGAIGAVDAVTPLIEAFTSADAEERRCVIEALGQIGDPRAVPLFLAHLHDTQWQIRWACAEALGRIGAAEAVPQLLSLARDSHSYVCRAVITALGSIGGTEVVPYLIQALQSKKGYLQRAAEKALKEIGTSQTVPYLLHALHSEQVHVRKEAEHGLRHLSDTRAAPYLIQTLRDTSDVDVRRIVIETIGRTGTAEASSCLIPLLDDPDEALCRAAAQALGVLGDLEAVPHLSRLLQASSSHVRQVSVRALGRLGSCQVVPALVERLQDRNLNVRRAAAEALGRLGDRRAVPRLLDALQDSAWVVRWSAAYALGRLEDQDAVSGLLQSLEDENENVRRASAEALGQLGSSLAVQALMKTLLDNDWSVRWAAAYALGQIGDPEAVPDLLECLNDPHEKVRWAATEALGTIGDLSVVPQLLHSLLDRNWDVRRVAARALMQVQHAEMIPFLIQIMRKQHDYVRRTATKALRQICDDRAIPYLTQALREQDDRYIQTVAVEQVVRIGGREAVIYLLPLLRHSAWFVRKLTAESLGSLAYTIDEPRLLTRIARGVWWRLTDREEVALPAFRALKHVISRLAEVNVSRSQ